MLILVILLILLILGGGYGLRARGPAVYGPAGLLVTLLIIILILILIGAL